MLWAWVSLLIRSGMILAAAEIMRRCSRRFPGSTAGYRYRILLTAFALLLVWPLFSAILPRVDLPMWTHAPSGATVTVEQTVISLERRLPLSAPVNWPLAIWLMGMLLSLMPLIFDYFNVRRLIHRATRLEGKKAWESGWCGLLQQECSRLGLRKTPDLLMYSGPVVPFTFGLYRPSILLPMECIDWEPLRKRTVLLHELAHIKRQDLLWQTFANLTTALWWFQPLCWWNRRSLRRESEQACDYLVLSSGIRPSDYAGELLEFARNFSQSRWSSAALSMARRGELEGRLYAILDPRPKETRRRPFLATAALTALTLTASAVTVLPEQNDLPGGHPMKRTLISGLLASAGLSAATIGGSVFDSGGSAISNAQASLYNPETSAKQETTTTAEGKFAFASLNAGSYILRIEKPGFASLYREFNVKPDSEVQRGLVLKNASPPQKGPAEAERPERVAEAHSLNPKPLRIGGDVEEANLVRKVQPVYPAAAKTAHTQGVVDLEVVISKEGLPEDIRVLSSPSDDLTESALDAVRQWRYRPTLLNGEPVEILTDVIVNYTLLP